MVDTLGKILYNCIHSIKNGNNMDLFNNSYTQLPKIPSFDLPIYNTPQKQIADMLEYCGNKISKGLNFASEHKAPIIIISAILITSLLLAYQYRNRTRVVWTAQEAESSPKSENSHYQSPNYILSQEPEEKATYPDLSQYLAKLHKEQSASTHTKSAYPGLDGVDLYPNGVGR